MPARNTQRRVAVVPGTFDPPTNGHLETVQRAAYLFDEVVVAVATASSKQTLFDLPERLELIAAAVKELQVPRVRVRELSDRLLVELAREEGAIALVKGIRAVGDFDYELQMAHMNARLAPEVETVAIFASAEYSFLSSTLVREIAKLGGDVSQWVPAVVAKRLSDYFGGQGAADGSIASAGSLLDAEGGADRMGGFVRSGHAVR